MSLNQPLSLPPWLTKLARRLLALEPGRYQIILTIGKSHDWTVTHLGKPEG